MVGCQFVFFTTLSVSQYKSFYRFTHFVKQRKYFSGSLFIVYGHCVRLFVLIYLLLTKKIAAGCFIVVKAGGRIVRYSRFAI